MGKSALIFGVSGQDGAYLSKYLLAKGYTVYGTSRDAGMTTFGNLKKLGIFELVKTLSVNPGDFRSVLIALSVSDPVEIYNLAGQSSVALSFDQPVETFTSINVANVTILDAIRFYNKSIRYYNAGSSECYGNCEKPAKETDALHPRSPYAVAKAGAFWQVANYREAYGMYACSGILFNHESVLRPERFVTQKIVKAAVRILKGSPEKLKLGNISIARDWGLAEEYVVAMWLMLQQESADDYNIASGITCTLENYVDYVFKALNLNWKEHVEFDNSLLRPSDIKVSIADVSKAEKQLSFKATSSVKDVVKILVENEIGNRSK